jgi:NADH-quinone oxidoreductase subunit N
LNDTLQGIWAISGPLFVAIMGMVVLVIGLGETSPAGRRFLPLGTILGLVAAGILTLVSSRGIPNMPDVTPARFFGQGMLMDDVGGWFCVTLCLAAALTAGMAPAYLEEKRINNGEFYALLLFATCGAMLMALANDLINVFVGLEILSVSLYILCGFSRRELRSEEAAVKYFLLGAFASAFFVFGSALIYGAVGIANRAISLQQENVSFTNFDIISEALQNSARSGMPLMTSPLFVTGIALIVVGLGFKASLVPFHSYAPDVYEGAPTPVTAFMSAGAKLGAFAAFLRLSHAFLASDGAEPYRLVLWTLAAATMLVGNVLAMRQTNIKRMLACSSIAHAGYLLVGILASSHGSASLYATQSVLFYLLAYTLMNLGAFAVIIWLGRNGGDYLDIRDYAGLAKKQPLAALTLTICLLSLAGIPPTAGFFGKLYLFMAAIRSGEVSIAVIGLVISAIGLFYYLNLIMQMYLREPHLEFEEPREGGAKRAAILAAILTIILGVAPNLLVSPSPAGEMNAPPPVPMLKTRPGENTLERGSLPIEPNANR